MPAIKTGSHTWVAFTVTDRDATGSDHRLEVNDICTVLSDGARYRCTAVTGAATSTWTGAAATSDTWASVLANGRTSGANSPQITAGQSLEYADDQGTPVVRAREQFDSAGGLWKKIFYTAEAAIIATTSVDTATGKWVHDKDVTVGSTAVAEDRLVSILTGGNINAGRIYFGDVTSATAGQLAYNHNLTRFEHFVEGTIRAILTTAAWLPNGTMDVGSSSARWDDVFGVKGNFSTNLFIDNATGSLTNVDASYDDLVIGDGATTDRGITFKMDGASIRKAGIAIAEGATSLQAATTYNLDLNRWEWMVENVDRMILTTASLIPSGTVALGTSGSQWSDLRAQAATITGQINVVYNAATIVLGNQVGGIRMTLDGAAATSAYFAFQQGGTPQWDFGQTHNDNDFWLDNRVLGGSIQFVRSTNRVILPADLTVGANLAVTADVTIGTDAGGARLIAVNAAAANEAQFYFRQAGFDSWIFTRLGTSKDLQIKRRNDTGGAVDTPISVSYSTGEVTFANDVDVATDLRCRGVHIDGDHGTGIASTLTLTNLVHAAGDTAPAAIGNWRVNGSAGLFHGWIKFWDGTDFVSVPAWRAA